MPTRKSPLQGVRVIDASTILAGPLCCQILGDFGADVIKVEHPKRPDGMRGHGPSKEGVPLWWTEISRNKRTVAIDLKNPQGAEVMKKLVSTADVLVENFRPGVLENWGLGPDELLEINPGLVMVRITGFGQIGPYANRPGFGTLAEAMSGFADLTGQPDGPPTLPAFGLADSICGIAASSATLMALRHKDMTGEGQVVDLSILEPIMTAVGPGPTVYQQTGHLEKRKGNRSSNNAPRNTYITRDGQWVAISTSAQSIAERVMILVGHPEVLEEPWFSTGEGRAQHVEVLDEYVGSWIASRDRAEVLQEFEKVGAAISAVYNARDLVEDVHVKSTEMLTIVHDEKLGEVLQHNVMWRMQKTPGEIRFTGRSHAADTDQVLQEIGFNSEEIETLKKGEAIK